MVRRIKCGLLYRVYDPETKTVVYVSYRHVTTCTAAAK